jgi:hypothetical protein
VPDDPVQIVRFWEAVEIFSPQTLPKPDSRTVRDFRAGDPMPWEPGSGLKQPDEGKTWRHEVFGGVYRLSKVRDVLVEHFGDDNPETPTRGESALFACAVDGDGLLIDGSVVMSACAWACGQLEQGKSPLSSRLPDINELPGPRTLTSAIKKILPDAVSGGLAQIVTSALATLGGPLAAAGDAVSGAIPPATASRATQAITGGAEEPTARLGINAITSAELHAFTAALTRRLAVANPLDPKAIRVRSYQIKNDQDPEISFLNSFIVDDLARVAGALQRHDAGRALSQYLKAPTREHRIDVRENPQTLLDGVAPGRTPPGRWVTSTDRPLAFSQQFAVNQALAELKDSAGLFAVNGPPGTGKTTMLRDLIAAVVTEPAIRLAALSAPARASRVPRGTGRQRKSPTESCLVYPA